MCLVSYKLSFFREKWTLSNEQSSPCHEFSGLFNTFWFHCFGQTTAWRWNCKSMMIVVLHRTKNFLRRMVTSDIYFFLSNIILRCFGQPSVNVLSWHNLQRHQFAQFCTQKWKLQTSSIIIIALKLKRFCGTKKWNYRLALAHIIYFYSILTYWSKYEIIILSSSDN